MDMERNKLKEEMLLALKKQKKDDHNLRNSEDHFARNLSRSKLSRTDVKQFRSDSIDSKEHAEE
jgi:hypothetical protein